MTWLDPRRTQKQENFEKSCDRWSTNYKNLEKSQDTKHSDTLIRHLCHTAIAVSSEYTVGEVKFRALIEDGKDMRMSNAGDKQIPNLLIQSSDIT